MDNEFKAKIKSFVSKGIEENLVEGKTSAFWQQFKDVGTELWLDTGDMEEAEKIWTDEMTALTTNNSLLNNEIQKGIYDDFISEAKRMVNFLPIEQQVVEIAFILNARHGLRLAQKFGGLVSVELHTDTSHDIPSIIEYGTRYFEINPKQFIVKVPYTAAGLLGAKKLREMGVKINFTLEFSARQNVMVAAITKPNYQNVFLGRVGAYIKNSGLGSGSGAGERTVLEAQKWVSKITKNNPEPTKLIAASLRSYEQLETLAGVDVFTMPTKVAAEGREKISNSVNSKVGEKYPVDLIEGAGHYFPEKLWEVSEDEWQLAQNICNNCPRDGNELIDRFHAAGCADMFPYLSDKDLKNIADDGKIPHHERWARRIENGEIAIDTLLNLAGLASFANDQKALDDRIRRIIES